MQVLYQEGIGSQSGQFGSQTVLLCTERSARFNTKRGVLQTKKTRTTSHIDIATVALAGTPITRKLTYNNKNRRKVTRFFGGNSFAANSRPVILSDSCVDHEVGKREEGEGDDAGTEESRPVNVVQHVIRIHSQACHVEYQNCLGRVGRGVKVFNFLVPCFHKLWYVQSHRSKHGW